MRQAPISRSGAAAAFVLLNGAVETSVWVIMLPTVARDFDAGKTAIAWVVVAFALGMAGAGLAAGRLCDLIGLKRVGMVSLAAELPVLSAIVVVLIMLFAKNDAADKAPVRSVLRSFDWWGATSFLPGWYPESG
jgi:MFS family permease